MDNYYMLLEMDKWITGGYGEDRDDGWLGEPEEDESEEDMDYE